jgi:hypothetical protein
VATCFSRTLHTNQLLPLLPSGPDGVHNLLLQGDQRGHPKLMLIVTDLDEKEIHSTANPFYIQGK